MTNESKYTVGTSETGSFLVFNSEAEARNEADNWNQSTNETVYVWIANSAGEVIDTLCSYGNAD